MSCYSCLVLLVLGEPFSKNAFPGGTNFVGKSYREIVLVEGTNDQIISRGRSFKKCMFQESERCKSEKFSQPW